MKDAVSAYLQGGLVGAVIGLVTGVAVGLGIGEGRSGGGESVVTESRVTVYDTIRVERPMVRDSVVVRYETARLPLATDTTDTAAVAVPIERVEYSDTSYRAVIEGYQPRLISLDITAPREVITIERTLPSKRQRWGLSVGAGMTAIPKGISPGVFVGATYTFHSF